MLVVLDIFSGRPNPRWELRSDEESHLHDLLSNLRPRPETDALPQRLGYRGFILSSDKCERAGEKPVHLVVFHDAVVGTECNRQVCLEDPDRTLEHWLLESVSPKHLNSQLYSALKLKISKT